MKEQSDFIGVLFLLFKYIDLLYIFIYNKYKEVRKWSEQVDQYQMKAKKHQSI